MQFDGIVHLIVLFQSTICFPNWYLGIYANKVSENVTFETPKLIPENYKFKNKKYNF